MFGRSGGRSWNRTFSRELMGAVGFAMLCQALFLGKAYHIDEPFFIAVARHILQDPLRPLDFPFNWNVFPRPAGEIFMHSVLVPYYLAAAWASTGGAEPLMRLACLPVDGIAAGCLYAIAARFLRRPFWPVLLVVVSPGYWISMQHLSAEKWVMASALLSILSMMVSEERRWVHGRWVSLIFAGLAMTLKHTGAFVLGPLAWILWRNKTPASRLFIYLLSAVAFPLADALYFEPERILSLRVASEMYAPVSAAPFVRLHQLRAIGAYLGGAAGALLWLPWLAPFGKPKSFWKFLLGGTLLSAILFCPWLDSPIYPVMSEFRDRLLGGLFALGAVASMGALALAAYRRHLAGSFCLLWAASVLAFQAHMGWFVSARHVFFAIPPLLIGLAALLEEAWPEVSVRRCHRWSFAGVFLLGICVNIVDYSQANSHRSIASLVPDMKTVPGRRVWFVGHWGFQHYMSAAGALQYDESIGGLGAARPGDVIVRLTTDYTAFPINTRIGRDVQYVRVDSAIPLRLMGVFRSQAGFYSSNWGFLPFAISREPVEVFQIWNR